MLHLLDPPTRAALVMALMAFVLLGLGLAACIAIGGRWVRRISPGLRRPLAIRPAGAATRPARPELRPARRAAIAAPPARRNSDTVVDPEAARERARGDDETAR